MEKLIHDRIFANMTWLEQAVSGVMCPQHDILISAPEEIHMPRIQSMFNDTTVYLDKLYDYMRDKHDDICRAASFMQIPIRELYNIHITDDFEYNFATRQIQGDIYLVKKFTPREDKALIDSAVHAMQDYFSTSRGACSATRDRALEVLDLIDQHGSRDIRKSRDAEKLVNGAITLCADKIQSGAWNIKNTELITSMREWIIDYIMHNRVASMVNLTKFKLSTYQEGPIYSIPTE